MGDDSEGVAQQVGMSADSVTGGQHEAGKNVALFPAGMHFVFQP